MRFVAITCHDDVLDWLEPDWVIDMEAREFYCNEPGEAGMTNGENRMAKEIAMAECSSPLATGGSPVPQHQINSHVALLSKPAVAPSLPNTPINRRCLRRPTIEIELHGCDRSLWPGFAHHHYLNGMLNPAARCFLALWRANRNSNNAKRSRDAPIPIAFCATLPLMGRKNHRRISRIVTLPDFQGLGVGMCVVEAVAELHAAEGHRVSVTASHPSLLAHCSRSPRWRTTSVKPHGADIQRKRGCNYRSSTGRAVVSFECAPNV